MGSRTSLNLHTKDDMMMEQYPITYFLKFSLQKSRFFKILPICFIQPRSTLTMFQKYIIHSNMVAITFTLLTYYSREIVRKVQSSLPKKHSTVSILPDNHVVVIV